MILPREGTELGLFRALIRRARRLTATGAVVFGDTFSIHDTVLCGDP